MTYGTRSYGARAYGDSSLGYVEPPPPAGQTITVPSISDAAAVGAPTILAVYSLTVPSIGDASAVGAPRVFILLEISVPSIDGGPVVGAPLVTLPGDPEPDPRLRVWLADRAAPTVPILELDESFARTWLDSLNDTGTASLVLGLDDLDAAGIGYFDVVRFELDGYVRFAALVESKRSVVVSPDEEVGEILTVSGRGILALLEDALVYPEAGPGHRPFSDHRRFDFTSPDFDDSGWGFCNASAFTTVGGPLLDLDTIDEPEAWPSHEAYKIWPAVDTWPVVAPGVGFMRRWVEITEEGLYRVFVTADDGIELFVDSVALIGEIRDGMHRETTEVDVYLTAGWHLFAAKGTNLFLENAWIVFALFSLRPSGAIFEPWLLSDSTWRGVFAPPSTPGFTPGAIVRLLVEDAQARGDLPGLTLGFSDTVDTAGNAWPQTSDVALAHGLDLLSAFKQLAETYFDFDLGVDLVLRLWATRGEETGATFAEGTNLLELVHDGKV